jgi:hypothetical protein
MFDWVSPQERYRNLLTRYAIPKENIKNRLNRKEIQEMRLLRKTILNFNKI